MSKTIIVVLIVAVVAGGALYFATRPQLPVGTLPPDVGAAPSEAASIFGGVATFATELTRAISGAVQRAEERGAAARAMGMMAPPTM